MSLFALVEFMVSVEESMKENQALHCLDRLLEAYRIPWYGLLRQPKPHQDPLSLVLAGRWPKGWPETYIRKKYVLVDPTLRHLAIAQRGFRWSEAYPGHAGPAPQKRIRSMMIEAQRYGLEDGYIFPVHGRGGLLGNLTIGGPRIDLSPAERDLFSAAASALFWKMIALRGVETPTDGTAVSNLAFTRRELEVLNYLADGYTSNEIARILGISTHTVDWYMNGLQTKLNAKNRQHAVAIAIRSGLVF